MKLSAYTKASNCTDLADIKVGIEEIQNYIYQCETVNKKPIKSAYIRLWKLSEKEKQFKK